MARAGRRRHRPDGIGRDDALTGLDQVTTSRAHRRFGHRNGGSRSDLALGYFFNKIVELIVRLAFHLRPGRWFGKGGQHRRGKIGTETPDR